MEKLAAVRCYATQLDQLVASFGDFLGPAGLGREVLWERRCYGRDAARRVARHTRRAAGSRILKVVPCPGSLRPRCGRRSA